MPGGAEGDANPARAARYAPGSTASAARAWQEDLRTQFLALMKIDDLAARRSELPLAPQEVGSEDRGAYTLREMTLASTPGRRIPVLLAMPKGEGPFPAVVAIPGHGGTRHSPFNLDPEHRDRIYKGFGDRLAREGFAVIAAEVAQHEVYEEGRTLMGERLWDLFRCVDYLESLPEVDGGRLGCAGLSLGGEMAMWIAAMDPRMRATVSAGFLTLMDQMERNHCMCWKFEGLRERVDWPDVYGMIAPRALQCQNGLEEPENDFTVPLAHRALAEIQPAYRDLGAPGRVALHVHRGGHEIDLEPLVAFLIRWTR